MRLSLVTIFLSCLTLAAVPTADAQVLVQLSPSTPRLEFGAHLDVADFLSDASRTVGGRVSRRHADWLMSEFTYDRTRWTYESRESRLVIASMRLQNPQPERGRRAFISVGLAAAAGYTFGWSPVVISGAQREAPDGIAAIRCEFQWFARGGADYSAYDRARILVGVGVGIP